MTRSTRPVSLPHHPTEEAAMRHNAIDRLKHDHDEGLLTLPEFADAVITVMLTMPCGCLGCITRAEFEAIDAPYGT